jgi:hypothetical protein
VIDLNRQSIAQRMTTMHLIANAETIDRLVEQGVDFSKAFHAEYEKDPTGPEAQFLRGEFSGWRSTLHTEYHDGAEEIVDRVLAETCLPIPAGEIGTDVARAS